MWYFTRRCWNRYDGLPLEWFQPLCVGRSGWIGCLLKTRTGVRTPTSSFLVTLTRTEEPEQLDRHIPSITQDDSYMPKKVLRKGSLWYLDNSMTDASVQQMRVFEAL